MTGISSQKEKHRTNCHEIEGPTSWHDLNQNDLWPQIQSTNCAELPSEAKGMNWSEILYFSMVLAWSATPRHETCLKKEYVNKCKKM